MKRIFLLYCTLSVSINLYSQLDKVAPLTSVVHDRSRIKDINILINTRDFSSTFDTLKQDKYPTSVQLAPISHPFPPIWYQLGIYKHGPGLKGSDFFINPAINIKTGALSFGYNVVSDATSKKVKEGFVILDTSLMEVRDFLTGYNFSLDSIYEAVDHHDYEEDVHGNKLFFSSVRTHLDARCLSGNEADSLMNAVVQYIIVLDSMNQIKMAWNPLKHFSPCEMYWQYRNSSLSYPGYLNWGHGNSLRWANDGNILYSYRHIGVGKINSQTGEFIFKLGGKDTASSIPLPDSIGYSLQHDFYQRPDGKYSLFSNGYKNYLPFMRGLIYEINEKNKTVHLVDSYKIQPECISVSLGGFDTYNDLYFLNRGMNFCSSVNQMVDIVSMNDKSPVAELFGPVMNFSYRAHPTVWNISRRPKVVQERNVLKTYEIKGLRDYTWYRVSDTNAVKAGTGITFMPDSDGKYVVEAKAGFGSFVSFLLSDVFDFTLTNNKKKAKNK